MYTPAAELNILYSLRTNPPSAPLTSYQAYKTSFSKRLVPRMHRVRLLIIYVYANLTAFATKLVSLHSL